VQTPRGIIFTRVPCFVQETPFYTSHDPTCCIVLLGNIIGNVDMSYFVKNMVQTDLYAQFLDEDVFNKYVKEV
jgi:hypothetical protein